MSNSSRPRGRPPLTQRQSITRSSTANGRTSTANGRTSTATPRLGQRTTSTAYAFEENSDSPAWKSAIETFENVVTKTLKELQASIKKLDVDLGNAIEFQSQRIDDVEDKMAAIETECAQFRDKISALERDLATKDADINKMERMSRRNNLRVVGIPTSPNEDCEELLRTNVFSLFKEVPEVVVERCHRDGRGSRNRPPHILVRFLSHRSKTFFMRNRRAALKGQGFFIVYDLTKSDLHEKKKWTPRLRNCSREELN
ncbi:LINE-1 retrotransposable element ORF1 protein [Holothuria leucospilota]|uniref:LINE-1 retrotransposable element ORF1 protein n=1 Tax=Holothuria leucospilota TaxID=206669 RepID=A0A9Q0YNY2_HOLLE|nr:LINE-1 retrotransposable element ORF1 protein [Holothuria leucospilota]